MKKFFKKLHQLSFIAKLIMQDKYNKYNATLIVKLEDMAYDRGYREGFKDGIKQGHIEHMMNNCTKGILN